MERGMRYLLIALAAAVSVGIVATVAYRLHHRVVTSGSFSGFDIGSSKDEVLVDLLEKDNVSAIQVRVPPFRVSATNIDELAGLETLGAFLVQKLDMQITVYNDRGTISRYSRRGVGQELQAHPTSIGELLPRLKEFLVSNPDASVISIPRGFGAPNAIELSLREVPLSERERQWLFGYDHWAFVEDDRWTFFDLYFSEDRLAKVEFRNNFVELP